MGESPTEILPPARLGGNQGMGFTASLLLQASCLTTAPARFLFHLLSKDAFYLICGLSPRADVVPSLISGVRRSSPAVLGAGCRAAEAELSSEKIFFFSPFPFVLAEINRSRAAQRGVCANLAAALAFFILGLTSLGLQKTSCSPLVWPQASSFWAISACKLRLS